MPLSADWSFEEIQTVFGHMGKTRQEILKAVFTKRPIHYQERKSRENEDLASLPYPSQQPESHGPPSPSQ